MQLPLCLSWNDPPVSLSGSNTALGVTLSFMLVLCRNWKSNFLRTFVKEVDCTSARNQKARAEISFFPSISLQGFCWNTRKAQHRKINVHNKEHA